MIDRKKTNELIARYGIPQITIAVVSDVDKAQVSNFARGAKLATGTESAIVRAVSDIANVIEKAAPIMPNLSDGEYMKSLVRRWREEGCFVVMIGGTPAQYFAANKGRLITTRFLLQATPLTNELAEVIAEKLRADGHKAIAIENPYGVIDSRYDDLPAVWHETAAVTA